MPRRSLRLQCRSPTHKPVPNPIPEHADIDSVPDSDSDPDVNPIPNSNSDPDNLQVLDPIPNSNSDNLEFLDLYPERNKHLDNLDKLDLDMNDVRSGGYRNNCLNANGIYFRLPSDALPQTVALHTNQILAAAPRPSLMLATVILELDSLSTHGCSEASIIHCLSGFFPRLPDLDASHQRAMARHLLPACDDTLSLPQPAPDLLYGYSLRTFTKAQQVALRHIHPEIWSYGQATPEVSFPFFVVELKAAAGTGGSLWDASNQCAGGSAACLQALDQLNTALDDIGCQERIPNLCYSLALDNNLGQLYVSWKDGDFYIQRVSSFLLSDAQHFARLHACVAAIAEWGATRLQDIHAAADHICQFCLQLPQTASSSPLMSA
ncbi:hypothetical protein OQA88_4654 [Cercophora sp. LCS_1]